jgi:hypothetical protein
MSPKVLSLLLSDDIVYDFMLTHAILPVCDRESSPTLTMSIFTNLFKPKRQREIERDINIQRSLSLHKQQIGKLTRHERQYMEKAQRAKKMGDTANLRQICRLIAQTTNQRRAIESQLLHFETLIQTRDRAKLFGEFAKGMKAMSRSIRDTFEDFNAEEVMGDLEKTLAQTSQMENAMSMVLERISAATDVQTGGEDAVSAEDIEKIIDSQASTTSDSLDKEIEASLKAIEQKLRNRTQA